MFIWHIMLHDISHNCIKLRKVANCNLQGETFKWKLYKFLYTFYLVNACTCMKCSHVWTTSSYEMFSINLFMTLGLNAIFYLDNGTGGRKCCRCSVITIL